MGYRVGSVPYLNAKPLLWGLQEPGSPVVVDFDVPSKLPSRLEDGSCDAVLVSSIEALRRPGARIADGVSISSYGEVMSVKIFSKVEPEKISSLALDQSSMTSNALAQIVLGESYRARPVTSVQPPNLDLMLEKHDAGVLIGDNGMKQSTANYYVIDLGLEWRAITGLPFVWAVWLGGDRLDEALSGHLFSSAQKGMINLERYLPQVAQEADIPLEIAEHYLTQVMDYELGEDHLSGLEAYLNFLMKYQLLEVGKLPKVVTNRWAGV